MHVKVNISTHIMIYHRECIFLRIMMCWNHLPALKEQEHRDKDGGCFYEIVLFNTCICIYSWNGFKLQPFTADLSCCFPFCKRYRPLLVIFRMTYGPSHRVNCFPPFRSDLCKFFFITFDPTSKVWSREIKVISLLCTMYMWLLTIECLTLLS